MALTPTRKAKLTGNTFAGLQQFSGTNHAGIKLISLTTTQRDALTPANGMLIYNATTATVQKYEAGAWSDVGAGTPSAHASTHQNGGSDEISVAGLSGLLADGQTPITHASTHASAGSDPLTLAQSQVTSLTSDLAAKLAVAGGTMTGQLNFSGTTHAGIKLISLTTTQRDALTAANGMLIYNSTTATVQKYEAGAWVSIASAGSPGAHASSHQVGGSDPVSLLYDENPSSPTAPSATGTNSMAFGSGALAWRYGERTYASGVFASSGDSVQSNFMLRAATTNATQTEAFLDGNGGVQRIILDQQSAMTFRIQVVARRTDADGEADGWEFAGLLIRNSGASSASLVALQENHIGSTAWLCEVDIYSLYEALRVRVTGEAAKSISWVVTVSATEIVE